MIPRKIHYCWFGKNQKTDSVLNYINSWKEKLPDYELIEWNEDTFDINNACGYVQEAYKSRKWAFVADYVRLYALFHQGGIYLDTDVEILKKFDNLLDCKMFLGTESKYSICTAVIGAEKGNAFFGDMLMYYENNHFINDDKEKLKPNTQIFYDEFKNKFNYTYSNEKQEFNGIILYPEDFFSPINSYTLKKKITKNTYTIHWFNASWKSKRTMFKFKVLAYITRIIGEDNRERLKRRIKNGN